MFSPEDRVTVVNPGPATDARAGDSGIVKEVHDLTDNPNVGRILVMVQLAGKRKLRPLFADELTKAEA